jgi:hypothetical protein
VTYQLVLQYSDDSIEGLDTLTGLEDAISEELGDTADVDGHDIGSGEANIFIITSDPTATFQCLQPVLQRYERLDDLAAAYRQISDDSYTSIWPPNPKEPFTIK